VREAASATTHSLQKPRKKADEVAIKPIPQKTRKKATRSRENAMTLSTVYEAAAEQARFGRRRRRIYDAMKMTL
jgi:hypothetical protein